MLLTGVMEIVTDSARAAGGTVRVYVAFASVAVTVPPSGPTTASTVRAASTTTSISVNFGSSSPPVGFEQPRLRWPMMIATKNSTRNVGPITHTSPDASEKLHRVGRR